MLSRIGFAVLEASTIKEALDHCRCDGRRIHLAIIDHYFVDGLGTQAALRIREHFPNVPILITSGTPLEGWRDNELLAFTSLDGAVDFLPKPFLIGVLEQKAQNLMRQI